MRFNTLGETLIFGSTFFLTVGFIFLLFIITINRLDNPGSFAHPLVMFYFYAISLIGIIIGSLFAIMYKINQRDDVFGGDRL